MLSAGTCCWRAAWGKQGRGALSPPGSGFLVDKILVTWENCSSLPLFSPLSKPPVSSHTELAAVARGGTIMREKFLTKGLKGENRPSEKWLPKHLKKKKTKKSHSTFSKLEQDSWKMIPSQFQNYNVHLGSNKLGSFSKS